MTANLVIDASVAVKWIVPEKGEDAAERLLMAGGRWLAPDLLIVEVSNVMRTRIGRGELLLAQAEAGISFVRGVIDQLVPDAALADRALQIALAIRHGIYDCLYMACAEQADAQMITADERLFRKLHGTDFKNRVHLLDA